MSRGRSRGFKTRGKRANVKPGDLFDAAAAVFEPVRSAAQATALRFVANAVDAALLAQCSRDQIVAFVSDHCENSKAGARSPGGDA